MRNEFFEKIKAALQTAKISPLAIAGLIILASITTMILSFELQKDKRVYKSKAAEGGNACIASIREMGSNIENLGVVNEGQKFECRVTVDAPGYTDIICGYIVGNARWPKNCSYKYTDGLTAVFECDPTQPTNDNLPLPQSGDSMYLVAMRGDQVVDGNICKDQWNNEHNFRPGPLLYYINRATATNTPILPTTAPSTTQPTHNPSVTQRLPSPPPPSPSQSLTRQPTCPAAVSAPTNLRPTGEVSTTGTVSFQWNVVAGAARYALRIDDHGEEGRDGPSIGSGCQKGPKDVCIDVLTTNSYQYQLEPNHIYAWWVHAINTTNDIGCTAWSPAATGTISTIARPSIITPTTQTPPAATSTIAASPTRTLTPTTNPTPQPANVVLNLKLRFQGILTNPQQVYNRMNVRIALKSMKNGQSTEFQSVIFQSDVNGVWLGKATFSVIPNTQYAVYIKGPKHIQKRVCVVNPAESSAGIYRCRISDAGMTLQAGENELNFSNIVLVVGDLPEQDGIVNSYDLAKVRNNLGSTSADALAVADLNLDGAVNARDFSLILAALSFRTDDE